jgi:uncharacterized protein (UPF0305 family)
MKVNLQEIVKIIISTIIACGITILFARGAIINKKADTLYVDQRDKEVIEYVDKMNRIITERITETNQANVQRLEDIKEQGNKIYDLVLQHMNKTSGR